MSFQMKSREPNMNNMDQNTKQKIINQLKSEVESLKAKYILDEKSRGFNENNNYNNNSHLVNPKQSDEFRKTIPQKHEKENMNSNFQNFSRENNIVENEINYLDKNENYLEKNDSVILEDDINYKDINKNTQRDHDHENLYPKEYKRGNLNLNNLNDLNCIDERKNFNNIYDQNMNFSQSYNKKEHFAERENPQANLNMTEQNRNYKGNKIIDYEMFDKAKENLMKIRNDLDELDKYDINKNKRTFNFLGSGNTNDVDNNKNKFQDLIEERPKNFEEEISIHSKSIRDDSNINLINSNDQNRLKNNIEYNILNGNENLNKKHESYLHMDNENIAYNYDNDGFNQNEIYKKPNKQGNIGHHTDMDEKEYIQNNVKSFNSKNSQHIIYNQNEINNYSNISNREYNNNVNYSNEDMGENELLHENNHNRSPDSLLRYNNSDSQSPENKYVPNNTYSNVNNNLKRINHYTNSAQKPRESSPQDNFDDPYFKKMKGKYDPKYKKEKSKEKFEKLKEEIKQKFDVEHTFKPKINYNFSAKERHRESKEEYFKKLSTPKTIEINKRLREKEEIECLKMKEECTFKPNLQNKMFDEKGEYAPKPDKITTRLYKLAEQMKEKREKLKREQQENEVGNYSFTPYIDDYSKKLVMKYQNKPIHERYNEILTAKKQNLYLLRMDNERLEQSLYKPEINSKSKQIAKQNLDRSVDAHTHERLYREGIKKMRNRQENQPGVELEECTFSPQLCYSTTHAGGNIDDFLERQKIYDEIRKDRLDRKMSKSIENTQYTYKPKINLTSEFLVKADSNRINEKSTDKFERLAVTNYEKILIKKKQLEEFYYSQYDYKPKINEVSRYIGRDHSLRDLVNRKQPGKSKDYRSANIKEQIQECTFVPKTNKTKFENVQSNYKLDENIFLRINDEMKSKNEKVDGLKNYIDERDMKECKFRPDINKEIPRYDNKEPIVMKGFARHMGQMEKARKAKRDKELREKEVFVTGENWSRDNLITVPKPFNLSYQKMIHGKKKDDLIKRNKEDELKECTFKPSTNESKNKEIIKMILRE